ncbi:hypothetical protein TNCV_4858751 [Trichonephila clavipes]|nr:hypothetical protein TNCV_4858751 [Trichonephila clavipes]
MGDVVETRIRYQGPLKIRRVEGLMHIKYVEAPSPPEGVEVCKGGVPAQMLSSLRDRGPNLCGPLPTAFVLLYSAFDEAHFWLNGYVNKQNCRISSEANPQVYVETPLHPEKLTAWCALWAGGILLQTR